MVLKWPRPMNVTEIQSFLGLAGYYHRFVEGFSKIVVPLTRLTQKEVRFEWSDECEKSLQQLKEKLIFAPVLALPVSGQEFIVYSDASIQGLGCVLMHNEWVIAYTSRHWKRHPMLYLELAPVILILKPW